LHRLDGGQDRIVVGGGPDDEPVDGGVGDPRDVIGGARDRQDGHAIPTSSADIGDPSQEGHGPRIVERVAQMLTQHDTERAGAAAAQRPGTRVRSWVAELGRRGKDL
jgi:hypothetical protein